MYCSCKFWTQYDLCIKIEFTNQENKILQYNATFFLLCRKVDYYVDIIWYLISRSPVWYIPTYNYSSGAIPSTYYIRYLLLLIRFWILEDIWWTSDDAQRIRLIVMLIKKISNTWWHHFQLLFYWIPRLEKYNWLVLASSW